MRVKNTQEQKQIYNVFFNTILLVWNFIISIVTSVYYFLFKKNISPYHTPVSYVFFDYIFRQWPKYFMKQPSGYKVTKFFGDFIHHIFLKK